MTAAFLPGGGARAGGRAARRRRRASRWSRARSAVGPARREAAARGELTAELVELLRGAAELVASTAAGDEAARRASRDADRALVRLGARAPRSPTASRDGAAAARRRVDGRRRARASPSTRTPQGRLDRVLIAALALLALASFEAVQPLAAGRARAGRDARRRPAAARADRPRAGGARSRRRPRRARTGRSRSRSRTCARATRRRAARARRR